MSSPVRPTSLLYGFEQILEDQKKDEAESWQLELDDAAFYIQSVAKDYINHKRMEKAAIKVQTGPTPEHKACARLLIASRNENERLQLEVAHYSVSMTELITDLDRVKLRLISARTLLQLKDKTIAELRGAPNFERWGDWIVPQVGSG